MLSSLLGKVAKQKHKTHLKKGDAAPPISGKDQEGKDLTFDHFPGKKIVLFFYPQDGTLTCTKESCNLRDNYPLLRSKGYEVIGVSPDDETSHRKFSSKYKLPYLLIADTERKIINAYGVWGKKTLFGRTYDGLLRTTFLISEKRIIEKVITEVDSGDHAEQIVTSK